MPVLRVLSRVWQQRDARRWSAHGRDRHGNRASIRISVDDNRVTVTPSRPGELHFAPLQVGRIRGALKTALEAIDQPQQAARDMPAPPVYRRPKRQPWPPSPRPRERVVLDAGPRTEPINHLDHLLARYRSELNHDRHDQNAVDEPAWPELDADGDAGGLAA